MTSQELEAMAATVISPSLDGAYQSGCHTASVWDIKAQDNIPRLMQFMHDFGLITARDPKGIYHSMTDVIHKVLNDLTIDDWAIIIGGDHILECQKVSHLEQTRYRCTCSRDWRSNNVDSESVKVTFKETCIAMLISEMLFILPKRKC